MILEKGDMWSAFRYSDLWLFTGNSHVKRNGELVMGRGLAKEVKEEFPASPGYLGWLIREIGCHLGTYGVLRSDNVPKIGVFQVNHDFLEAAKLSLIGFSCIRLMEIIKRGEFKNLHLNFPGIGNGKLDRAHVLPIISELPDCVHVWERE